VGAGAGSVAAALGVEEGSGVGEGVARAGRFRLEVRLSGGGSAPVGASWLALAGLPGGGALALRAGHPRALVLPNPLTSLPLGGGGITPRAWAVFALGAPEEAHSAPATAVACSEGAGETGRGAEVGGPTSMAATGAADGSMRLWTLRDGRLVGRTAPGGPLPRGIAALAFAGPRALVAGGGGGELVVWGWPRPVAGAAGPPALEPLARIAPVGPLVAPVSAVAGFAPPHAFGAEASSASSRPGKVHGAPGAVVSHPTLTLAASSRVVEAMRGCGEADVDEEGCLLVAAGTADGAVRVWEARPLGGGRGFSLQPAAAEPGNGGLVTGLSFRSDGGVLAIALGGEAGKERGGAALNLLEKTPDGGWRGGGKFALPAAPLASAFIPVGPSPGTRDGSSASRTVRDPREAPGGEAIFVCDARGFAQVLSGAGNRRQPPNKARGTQSVWVDDVGWEPASLPEGGEEVVSRCAGEGPSATQWGGPAPFENRALSEAQALLARLSSSQGGEGRATPDAAAEHTEEDEEATVGGESPRRPSDLPDPFEQDLLPPAPRRVQPQPQPQTQQMGAHPTPRRAGVYLRKRLEVLKGAGPMLSGGRDAAAPRTPTKPAGLRVAIPTPGMRGLADLMSPAAKTPGSKAPYPADRLRQLPAGCPLAEPAMYSSARLQRRVRRIQAEKFDIRSPDHVGKELDAGVVAAEEATAQAHFGQDDRKYCGLTPIEGAVPEELPRKVPKQVDPRWVASLAAKPQMSDLWVLEERLPHVCSEGAWEGAYQMAAF